MLTVHEDAGLGRVRSNDEIAVDGLRIRNRKLHSGGIHDYFLGDGLGSVADLAGFEVIDSGKELTSPLACAFPLSVGPDLSGLRSLEGHDREVGLEARGDLEGVVIHDVDGVDHVAVLILGNHKLVRSVQELTHEHGGVADEFVVDIHGGTGQILIFVEDVEPAVRRAKILGYFNLDRVGEIELSLGGIITLCGDFICVVADIEKLLGLTAASDDGLLAKLDDGLLGNDREEHELLIRYLDREGILDESRVGDNSQIHHIGLTGFEGLGEHILQGSEFFVVDLDRLLQSAHIDESGLSGNRFSYLRLVKGLFAVVELDNRAFLSIRIFFCGRFATSGLVFTVKTEIFDLKPLGHDCFRIRCRSAHKSCCDKSNFANSFHMKMVISNYSASGTTSASAASAGASAGASTCSTLGLRSIPIHFRLSVK